jgi:hypothetical protein
MHREFCLEKRREEGKLEDLGVDARVRRWNSVDGIN